MVRTSLVSLLSVLRCAIFVVTFGSGVSLVYAQEVGTLPVVVAPPVVGAAPVVTLGAVPSTSSAGGAVILTWDAAGATMCEGSGFDAGGTASGSVTVNPTLTSTYSIACRGLGGEGSTSTTVTVTSAGGGGSGGGSSRSKITAVSNVTSAAATSTPVAHTQSRASTSWVHTIWPGQSTTELQALGYELPYFTYGPITAPLMQVHSAAGVVILTAGLGSKIQTVHGEFMILKDGIWHAVPAQGIWPLEANGKYRGKAYYILRPSDPLFSTSGWYLALIHTALPGCTTSSCVSRSWTIQGWDSTIEEKL